MTQELHGRRRLALFRAAERHVDPTSAVDSDGYPCAEADPSDHLWVQPDRTVAIGIAVKGPIRYALATPRIALRVVRVNVDTLATRDGTW